jgi:hypothetical protein
MNDDLDQLLGQLASRPAHPGLDAASDAVLMRIAVPTRAAGLPLAAGLAALLAVGVGVLSAWSERADARSALPLYAGQALAPATLLVGDD